MTSASSVYWLGKVVLLGASALGVAAGQSLVARQYESLQSESDVYALPQVEQLLVFSLGYRAAAADLLFGRTMVAAGTHFVEHRVFEHLDSYLKGIIALDPGYADVYRYADALLNLSTVVMPVENLRRARDIQESGMERFPDDAELWLTAGQFIAYLAPQRLPETEDKEEWRRAGAAMIQRSCELRTGAKEMPDVCMRSSSLMAKRGETGAAIRAMERLIAIADDPATRAKAMKRLQSLEGQRDARRRSENLRRIERLRVRDLPVVSRMRYQLLVPPFDPRSCLLVEEANKSETCATSFARYRLLATHDAN